MSATVLESRPPSSIVLCTDITLPKGNQALSIPSPTFFENSHYQRARALCGDEIRPGEPPDITLSFEEIEEMRSGFKADTGIPHPDFEKKGGTIFDEVTLDKTTKQYNYAHFRTKNRIPWQLDFNMEGVPQYPLVHNFNTSHIADYDLSQLYFELYYRQRTEQKSFSGYEVQHALAEHLVDENIEELLEVWSGQTLEEGEEVFVFREPVFEKNRCPDRVYIWPKVGIFPVDVYQRRKKSNANKYNKNKQFKTHVDGITNLFYDLYGDQAEPFIVPILIKFRLDDEVKSLAVKPFFSYSARQEPYVLERDPKQAEQIELVA